MSASRWIIQDTRKSSVQHNMGLDAKFLAELDPLSTTPILHLYDWQESSATYGHFIDPKLHLSEEVFRTGCLQLAKRPTGGGVIFHTTDWAFSILVPAGHEAYSVNTLDNYAFVNHLVIEVISRFLGTTIDLNLLPIEEKPLDISSSHFCMGKPTKYDVMWNGKKVCGGAQRRTKAGFLHQGTISLMMPEEEFLRKVLLPGTFVREAMYKNTFALLGSSTSEKDLLEARKQLSSSFQQLCQEMYS